MAFSSLTQPGVPAERWHRRHRALPRHPSPLVSARATGIEWALRSNRPPNLLQISSVPEQIAADAVIAPCLPHKSSPHDHVLFRREPPRRRGIWRCAAEPRQWRRCRRPGLGYPGSAICERARLIRCSTAHAEGDPNSRTLDGTQKTGSYQLRSFNRSRLPLNHFSTSETPRLLRRLKRARSRK